MSRFLTKPPSVSRRHCLWQARVLAVAAVLCVALFTAGLIGGRWCGSSPVVLEADRIEDSDARYHDGSLFLEAWHAVELQFFSTASLKPQSMVHGAISGMVASLGDPHSRFVPPEQVRLDTDTFRGEFGGIGVSLVMEEREPTIVDVGTGSSAEKAGLCAGDVVRIVDGRQLSGLSLDEIVLLIRGDVGTHVKLDLARGESVWSVDVVREPVEVPSLSWHARPDGFGYVRIGLFSGRTGGEFEQALAALRLSGVHALVLDLRGNGGGVVESALEVLGQLVGHGIGYREISKGGSELRHPIPFRAEPNDWPLAVLVDGGTASASELVAAAIRDHNRGVLIGAPTFGKGSMQGIFLLSDASSVRVTISRWLSPGGHPIESVGVRPDIVVRDGDSGSEVEDMVLQRAIEYLASTPKAALPCQVRT